MRLRRDLPLRPASKTSAPQAITRPLRNRLATSLLWYRAALEDFEVLTTPVQIEALLQYVSELGRVWDPTACADGNRYDYDLRRRELVQLAMNVGGQH